MANLGVIPIGVVVEQLNHSHYDAKRAVKQAFTQINDLLADYADPSQEIIMIDGVEFNKNEDAVALQIAMDSKLERLENKSTTILGIFDALLKLENKLTQ